MQAALKHKKAPSCCVFFFGGGGGGLHMTVALSCCSRVYKDLIMVQRRTCCGVLHLAWGGGRSEGIWEKNPGFIPGFLNFLKVPHT